MGKEAGEKGLSQPLQSDKRRALLGNETHQRVSGPRARRHKDLVS